MRENESDSEDGREQPPEYVNPWAMRDHRNVGAPGSELNAPEDGYGRQEGGNQAGYWIQPEHGTDCADLLQ